jgi:hypothetical protein
VSLEYLNSLKNLLKRIETDSVVMRVHHTKPKSFQRNIHLGPKQVHTVLTVTDITTTVSDKCGLNTLASFPLGQEPNWPQLQTKC